MNTRTRILFIHHFGGWGGASMMLANIIAGLDKSDFDPVVVCPRGDVVERFEEAGASVILAPRPLHQFMHISGYSYPIFHPTFVRRFVQASIDKAFWRDFIREQSADIVHLNAVTLAPMADSARAAGAKVVCLVQETAVHGLFGLRSAWLRHLLSTRMDAAVFISEYDRQEAKCHAPVVEVIPNWVNLSKFDRRISSIEARAKLDIPENARVVLFLGGTSRIKGALPLLRSIPLLADVEHLKVLIAGYNHVGTGSRIKRFFLKDDYSSKIQRALQHPAVRECAHFFGMTSDVVPLYAAADVVAFPSVSPHQARPVLEAGAMARPVVVSDFPHTREFVSDGVNGLLAKPNDPQSLAYALRKVLTDSALAKRLGEENYLQTVKKHNSRLNCMRFTEIYSRVAKEQKTFNE